MHGRGAGDNGAGRAGGHGNHTDEENAWSSSEEDDGTSDRSSYYTDHTESDHDESDKDSSSEAVESDHGDSDHDVSSDQALQSDHSNYSDEDLSCEAVQSDHTYYSDEDLCSRKALQSDLELYNVAKDFSSEPVQSDQEYSDHDLTSHDAVQYVHDLSSEANQDQNPADQPQIMERALQEDQLAKTDNSDMQHDVASDPVKIMKPTKQPIDDDHGDQFLGHAAAAVDVCATKISRSSSAPSLSSSRVGFVSSALKWTARYFASFVTSSSSQNQAPAVNALSAQASNSTTTTSPQPPLLESSPSSAIPNHPSSISSCPSSSQVIHPNRTQQLLSRGHANRTQQSPSNILSNPPPSVTNITTPAHLLSPFHNTTTTSLPPSYKSRPTAQSRTVTSHATRALATVADQSSQAAQSYTLQSTLSQYPPSPFPAAAVPARMQSANRDSLALPISRGIADVRGPSAAGVQTSAHPSAAQQNLWQLHNRHYLSKNYRSTCPSSTNPSTTPQTPAVGTADTKLLPGTSLVQIQRANPQSHASQYYSPSPSTNPSATAPQTSESQIRAPGPGIIRTNPNPSAIRPPSYNFTHARGGVAHRKPGPVVQLPHHMAANDRAQLSSVPRSDNSARARNNQSGRASSGSRTGLPSSPRSQLSTVISFSKDRLPEDAEITTHRGFEHALKESYKASNDTSAAATDRFKEPPEKSDGAFGAPSNVEPVMNMVDSWVEIPFDSSKQGKASESGSCKIKVSPPSTAEKEDDTHVLHTTKGSTQTSDPFLSDLPSGDAQCEPSNQNAASDHQDQNATMIKTEATAAQQGNQPPHDTTYRENHCQYSRNVSPSKRTKLCSDEAPQAR